MTGIAERLDSVQQRIQQACSRSGREASEVTLVGVSKRQNLDALRQAATAGLRIFGENQVQEASAKSAELAVDLEWHLIGPLQSNKVKPAVRVFHTIHSLDRPKIVQRLDREAVRQGRRLFAFLQVHLGDEPTKSGFPEEDFLPAVAPFSDLAGLEIVGLMAIPPFEEDPDQARKWFRRLRDLRDRMAEQPEWSGFPGALSMGMSHDFEVAIEEGATHVRVGTSIFGARPT